MSTKLVLIEQSGSEVSLKRYDGKTNTGIVKYTMDGTEDISEIKGLIEEYRVVGNDIYNEPGEAA
jgi:DNA-binding protein YbaB